MRPSAELQVGGRTNSDCFCLIAMINKYITADYSCLVNACQACNTHATSSRFQFQREITSLYFTTAILHCPISYTDFLRKRSAEIFTNYQLNTQFLYSSTTCMLHYGPQHVSSSTLLILRRTNFITTASGIVTLCKQPYSQQVFTTYLLRTRPLLSLLSLTTKGA